MPTSCDGSPTGASSAGKLNARFSSCFFADASFSHPFLVAPGGLVHYSARIDEFRLHPGIEGVKL